MQEDDEHYLDKKNTQTEKMKTNRGKHEQYLKNKKNEKNENIIR